MGEGQKDHKEKGPPASVIIQEAERAKVRVSREATQVNEDWWVSSTSLCSSKHPADNHNLPVCPELQVLLWDKPHRCCSCCPFCCSRAVLSYGCCSSCHSSSERTSSDIHPSCLKMSAMRNCWNGPWNPQDCCIASVSAWMFTWPSYRICSSVSCSAMPLP